MGICQDISAFVITRHKPPVHQRPKGLQIIRAHITVINVISVLPNITGQQGNLVCRQWSCSIAGIDNLNRAISIFYQPGPARAKVVDGAVGKFSNKVLKRAKSAVDGFGQGSGRLTTAIRTQAVPVESVVPDLRGVVENAAFRRFNNVFQGFAFQLCSFNKAVQLNHIGVVMLAIMVVQGFLGYVWLQSVPVIRQCRQFKRHNNSPLLG